MLDGVGLLYMFGDGLLCRFWGIVIHVCEDCIVNNDDNKTHLPREAKINSCKLCNSDALGKSYMETCRHGNIQSGANKKETHKLLLTKYL